MNKQLGRFSFFSMILLTFAMLISGFSLASDNEVTIKVTGMVCTGCERRIEVTLKDLSGIHTVEANYKKQTVFVKYTPTLIKPEAIVHAINGLGYGARI